MKFYCILLASCALVVCARATQPKPNELCYFSDPQPFPEVQRYFVRNGATRFDYVLTTNGTLVAFSMSGATDVTRKACAEISKILKTPGSVRVLLSTSNLDVTTNVTASSSDWVRQLSGREPCAALK